MVVPHLSKQNAALLEALERIMSRYDDTRGFYHYGLADIDKARAAIAQAKSVDDGS